MVTVLNEELSQNKEVGAGSIPFFKLEEVVNNFKNLTVEWREDSIDYALDMMIKGLELHKEIYEKLQNAKKKLEEEKSKEFFTMEEVETLKRKEERLKNWEGIVRELRFWVKEIENKIIKVIPKINKENFKIKTGKYILQIEGWNIARIDRIE